MVKGSRVPATHPHPEIPKVNPPPPGLKPNNGHFCLRSVSVSFFACFIQFSYKIVCWLS